MPSSRPPLVRILLAGLGLMLLVWLASLGAVLLWERNDQARPASAIVVLGAAQYVGRPSPVLRARLDHTIDLFRRRLAPVIIVTGGTGRGDTTSEAAVSRRYAIKQGVPASAILMETKGRTTSESMDGVAALMAQRHRRDVLLVSDPFHMLRLTILARRHGLVPYASPTPTSPIAANPSERWKYALSESIKAPLAFIFERNSP
ncbi:MAG TPA: YdcF family protein [Gemmatimonadaceae bacterium]|nr:YdcF family protein [Gemmatimonadaceae bacterium]